jgi:hypothetical protein
VRAPRQRHPVGKEPPVMKAHQGFKSAGIHTRQSDEGPLKRHSHPFSRLRGERRNVTLNEKAFAEDN